MNAKKGKNDLDTYTRTQGVLVTLGLNFNFKTPNLEIGLFKMPFFVLVSTTLKM